MTRPRSLLFYSVLLLGLIFTSGTALAQVDLTGKWRVVLLNQDQSIYRIETWDLTSDSTRESVTGTVLVSSTYGGQTGTISGSYDGDLFLQTTLTGSMFDTFCTSRTTTASSMSGDWYESMTNGGTFTATKLRTVEVTLSCQRGPTTSDDLVCTANVAANDQLSPAPTGTVSFSAEAGSFPSSSQCTLTSASTSSTSASCGVAYRPTDADAAAKTAPVILATYSGDDLFDSGSNSGVVTDVPFAPRETPTVCFNTTEQSCSGVNTILPTNLRKSGFGSITLGYFAPSTGSSSAMINVGNLPTARAQFTAPRNRRDIRVQLTYLLKPSQNSWYRATVPQAIRKLQPRAGVDMGKKVATIKFGQTKDVSIRMPSAARKVVNAAINAEVPQATVRVSLSVLRRGDTRPRRFFEPYVVNLVAD